MSVSAPKPAPRPLHPALVANLWPPGTSGNPGGCGRQYREVLRLARDNSLGAVQRLIELMDSRDPRVRLIACDKILERAWGKPKEPTEKEINESETKLNIAALLKLASMEELMAIRSLFARMNELQELCFQEAVVVDAPH